MLTRPMEPGEVPTTYTFIESASFSTLEGKVTIIEVASPSPKRSGLVFEDSNDSDFKIEIR